MLNFCCLESSACTYTVHCSVLNSTKNEIRVTLSGEGDRTSGLENVHEADYDEYDEDLSGYHVEDSIRGMYNVYACSMLYQYFCLDASNDRP